MCDKQITTEKVLIFVRNGNKKYDFCVVNPVILFVDLSHTHISQPKHQ